MLQSLTAACVCIFVGAHDWACRTFGPREDSVQVIVDDAVIDAANQTVTLHTIEAVREHAALPHAQRGTFGRAHTIERVGMHHTVVHQQL